ncbi:hypothetical protein E2C01_082749 [Portunus trituberculatus]|uniref:Uncharacterized protein n=1 Tax=Portunus trituberculatus TaxID=210409 RepID=A0A5B7IZY3_PORTR|nr:hypothetical protein [Portunus trituberculatus]
MSAGGATQGLGTLPYSSSDSAAGLVWRPSTTQRHLKDLLLMLDFVSEKEGLAGVKREAWSVERAGRGEPGLGRMVPDGGATHTVGPLR